MSKTMGDMETKFRLVQAYFREFKQEFKEFAHKMEQRFDSTSETMDSIVGDFKKFDERQWFLIEGWGCSSFLSL